MRGILVLLQPVPVPKRRASGPKSFFRAGKARATPVGIQRRLPFGVQTVDERAWKVVGPCRNRGLVGRR